jgi:hypothetical protein
VTSPRSPVGPQAGRSPDFAAMPST